MIFLYIYCHSLYSFLFSDCDEYDSDDPYESEEEEEEDDGISTNAKMGIKSNKDNKEHLEPLSYSWCILRLAFIKMFVKHLQDFINISGIELQGKKENTIRRKKFAVLLR